MLFRSVNRDQLPNTDVETAVTPAGPGDKILLKDAWTWLLLCLLLIGLVASVVGYVGCFSVVQNSISTIGPVSWLCLEAGLSVIRLAIWAWNPTGQDASPLEITLELDKHKPLPTCNKYNEEILQYKVLPLTRARDFLKIITSFAGLIEPFTNPDFSLYYTLTRKRSSKKSVPTDIEDNHGNEPENAEKLKLGERTLFITVFDHKERTTRVYTQDNEIDTFYSTKSDAPIVDVGRFILEVEIGVEIDPRGDPVCSNNINLDSLRKHHQSILEHIQYQVYRLEAADVTKSYTIETSWTVGAEDTISTLQRLREEENGDVWKTVVENGKEKERNDSEESLPICDYFTHPSIERERRLLDEKRIKWIPRRMEMITNQMKERFPNFMTPLEQRLLKAHERVEYRVNKRTVEKKPATELPEKGIEELLFIERYLMELLLVYEVKEWEQLFWNKLKAFLDQIGNDRVEVKERLTREWRANCWKRLKFQIHAAQSRLSRVAFGKLNRKYASDQGLRQRWASSVSQLFEGVEKPNSISLSELRKEIETKLNDGIQLEPLNEEIRLRMEQEIEDTEFRLKRGSDLGRFDQFWDDDALLKCRYSQSKWLHLSPSAPLEIYSHTLRGNKNITHIIFSLASVHSDSDLNRFQEWATSVTSISFGPLQTLPAIRRDPLFVKSIHNDLITFAKEIRPKLDPFSTYIFTDAEGSDISPSDKFVNNARVLISFVAPASDQSLILRLKHSGKEDGPLEVTLGSTSIQLNPSSKSLVTIDDMTLYPTSSPSESDRLSFEPGVRNDIVIQFRGTAKKHGHILHDIELLDEDGQTWSGGSEKSGIITVD